MSSASSTPSVSSVPVNANNQPQPHDDGVIPMDVTTPSPVNNNISVSQEKESKPTIPVVNHATYDVNVMINQRYSGAVRLQRLQFVAERCPEQAVAAATSLIQELKTGVNTLFYKHLHEQLMQALPSAPWLSAVPPMDQAWLDNTERQAIATQEKLEHDLANARSSTNREAIRVASQSLGNWFFRRGDVTTAIKLFSRARDHCTTLQHNNEYFHSIIKCAAEMKNFSTLSSTAAKALSSSSDKPTMAKFKAAAGLADMMSFSYKAAARRFLEVNSDMGNSFNDVLAPEDIGTYGGLLALAYMDRGEIKRLVLDNNDFRSFLGTVPQVQRIISDFFRSNYTSCLAELSKIRADLLLDLYFHDHVDTILKKIREKALVQYCSPFVSADMKKIAVAFNCSVIEIERELSQLIVDGQIQARIDSQNKVLIARHADQRFTMYQQALNIGKEFQGDAQAALFRMNLQKNEFVVRGSQQGPRDDSSRSKHKAEVLPSAYNIMMQ